MNRRVVVDIDAGDEAGRSVAVAADAERGRAIYSEVLEYLHSLSVRQVVGLLVRLTDYGAWRRRERKKAPSRTQILRAVRPGEAPFVSQNFIDDLMKHIPNDVFGRFNGEFNDVPVAEHLPKEKPKNRATFDAAVATLAGVYFNAAAAAAEHPAGGMRTRMLIWSVIAGSSRRAQDPLYSDVDLAADEQMRSAMSEKLSDELLRQHATYTEVFFTKFGYQLRPGKELSDMVDALAALLDGLLLRLGIDDDPDRWRRVFISGVTAIAHEFTHPRA